MTVAAEIPLALYDGDGVTVAFPAPWRYLTTEHLLVELIASDGTATPRTLGTHYAATAGATDAGGTVTMVTAPAVGQKLRVRRVTPLAQQTAYPTSGNFPAKSHELALDRLTLIAQEQAGDIDDVQARAMQVPFGEVAPPFPSAAARAGKFIAFDAGGVPVPASGSGADGALRADIAAGAGAGLMGTSFGLTVAEVLALSQPGDNIRYYGYKGNGASNPLSGVAKFKSVNTAGWTLAQWQTAVPQVTALTNEIDSVAVQAWYNDRPNGGVVVLPSGVSFWNTTVDTGLEQGVEIIGLGRDMTEVRWISPLTLWKHGFTGATAANKHFYARNFRVTPANGTASACMFNVRFSGTQAPWCHVISDVLVLARDTTSYFTNVTITRNIKRGIDWRNFNVFGRNFFILPTDAHLFPSNVASDPDCPPGQANTDAGDSYNFDNCMTVGYAYGWLYDWTGWTDTEHSHEQGHWKNCQSYSGKGVVKARNTNYAYAPADNWIIDTPGWQGIGPAFDFENCEQIRIRDGLLVADASSANNLTRGGQFINCADTIVEANEIFLEGSWTGGNFFAVGGANTANVRFIDNMTVHYAASISEWLFINSNVNFRQVEERGSTFRGTGPYATAKINDGSQSISETRVKDIVEALAGTSWSWDVQADGCTVFRNSYSGNTDGTGNISLALPAGLFRSIRNVSAVNGSTSVNSPVAVGAASVSAVPLRFTALAAITAVGVSIEVHGR